MRGALGILVFAGALLLVCAFVLAGEPTSWRDLPRSERERRIAERRGQAAAQPGEASCLLVQDGRAWEVCGPLPTPARWTDRWNGGFNDGAWGALAAAAVPCVQFNVCGSGPALACGSFVVVPALARPLAVPTRPEPAASAVER